MSFAKYVTLEDEMKKNPELKMSDIQILREWCNKQTHLPKIPDVDLAIFLHCNYYRIEPAKSTIENYYTIRTHVPEFFSNRDLIKVKELQQISKVVSFNILEEKTKEGYIIIVARFINVDPSHYVFNDTIKYGLMLFEEFYSTQGSVPGYICVCDAAGLALGHLARLNPTALKKFVYYIQDAIPIRLKAIHILNVSSIVELVYGMFKPFLKPELIELIHFHSSSESISKYISIDVLPNEYGGKAGPAQKYVDAHIKKIKNFREWYLEDEKINRVNESLRIGKSKTSNDLFGVEGSFKKLELD